MWKVQIFLKYFILSQFIFSPTLQAQKPTIPQFEYESYPQTCPSIPYQPFISR